MDGRPSVTETDRGGVHEMDRQTNHQKKEMPLKLIKFYKIFLKSFGQYEMDDRPRVTETDRGSVYEMDRQTNRQNNGNATEIDQIL